MGRNLLELILVQAWTGLRRNGLVALGAICNIAVSLTIVGGFFLLAANLEHVASGLASEAIISLELRSDTKPDPLVAKLKSDVRVRTTEFVSRDEALKQYAKAVNLPYKDLKGAVNNPLPDVIRVSVINPQDLAAVAAVAKGLEGVSRVRYRRDVAEKLLTVAQGVKMMGLTLGVLMGLAALLLVSTTIQMGVHSRRREIRVMQLVGATNAFIRAPFVIEGAAEGLIGGLVAAAMTLGGYGYLHARITENLKFVEMMYTGQFLLLVGAGLVLLGVTFGLLGSLIGTRRYLRLV